MDYPELPDFQYLTEELKALFSLKAEYGAKGLADHAVKAALSLKNIIEEIRCIPVDEEQAATEPNELSAIKGLRPAGPRRLWSHLNPELYKEKLEGSILARSAGCTLGAIVEGWKVEDMESWARQIGDPFPPADYWSEARSPESLRYNISRCDEYTRERMNGVPVDDDLIYTQLGLLLFEKHGLGFTTEDVARMWDEYLYWVWIDMQWPLERFRKGVCAEKAADGNPWQQMICAFIRCDPYAYVAPGWPQKAAEFSYRDGLLSHRRNGLYGGMFFAAAIAAAFAVDDPVEAIRIGLTEIPRECRLAQEIRWALDVGRNFRNYRDARRAVDEKMKGMHPVHTINNACLVVLGLMIGGRDVSRVLSETVAMGLDNDCTAATAGSIVGAVVGKKGIPERWHRRFYDKMHSYIKGHPVFSISDMVSRYARQAQIVSQRCP